MNSPLRFLSRILSFSDFSRPEQLPISMGQRIQKNSIEYFLISLDIGSFLLYANKDMSERDNFARAASCSDKKGIQRVLLIGQEEMRKELVERLKGRPFELLVAESLPRALDLLQRYPIELIFCDISIDLLKTTQRLTPIPLMILVAALHQTEKALDLVQAGALDYLITPFSTEAFEGALLKAEKKLHKPPCCDLAVEIGKRREQMIAKSPVMRLIVEDVMKIAKSDASVFISGESGAGKEVIAHAIHLQSKRVKEPFVRVNCAAIPESLIESEFFGHEKGAFTGAISQRRGRFELAHKGTLLLDEISEIPLSVQSKLLRAVQEQEFERVGGTKSLQVDVRFIATSNRNMKEAIEQNLFREDLYYRLNVIPIQLPPLRERREDIVPLAEYFLDHLCNESQLAPKQLSSEAKQKLLDYHWPGNVRELANIIERTLVMNSEELIQAHHLSLDSLKQRPLPIVQSSSLPLGMTLRELEKQFILETLSKENHNRTKAAKILGISIRTLRNKLSLYKTNHVEKS